ncbi:glyoxylate reductase [Cryptococcus neoformans C23]|uniref:Glyoxylate reductase n=2 Tax=Cryptococcus neoformans TaxID=5207 RepID=A0A854QCU1_CRYNE|nr:glyoxylate reductase [Cryptococcus neoformans var. grubii H99]AUB28064.1 glyoxylate reductase [Cryptococcus neoformans var. grubii]OWZ27745.1 glyoxylate reductase [Cryptococcus neoformans var. grubii AD2-60a]OWZ40049.1 glyoxylate reductase [Cryptococcus neoformans var. grubii C23]OWZ51127.1 glyoxylate reductase [Cryptococcus neoformans var. grubii 125.91]OXC81930.1 glyoxylate reductase [Cryptococcus neoformans var. grubii AD1-7a]OXG13196.1 glyoxylate reductase [Cryptococcus neoformans var.|eukprot:XP_012052452.1 glyoxylate reductase [Cryptococcus neoformans var. grubii H99]
MPKILVTRNLGEHAMAILRQSDYDLIVNPEDAPPSREWVLNHLADPQVYAACIMHSQPSDKVDKELIATANDNLRCISTFSVGYDHIDVKAANARGIKIGHTPGVLSDAVADIAVILVLSTLRRIGEGINLVKSGNWKQQPWAPFVNCGLSIGHPSLTIGFLGFGRISQATVRRLLAFTNKEQPPRIMYTSSYQRDNQDEIDANFSKTFGVEVRREEKESLASQADILIVLCDLNPSTKDLVNKSFFQRMKKSAILVNVARGPIVNSEDLHEALVSGQIFGAGLDVLTGEPDIPADHPLLALDNCLVLPHLGSADYDTRNAMAERCVRNAIAAANGEPLVAEVKV